MSARNVRRWFTFVAAACFALAACEIVSVGADSKGPARPKGVPEKAVWAGGVDGGTFILMSPAKADGTYPLRIYHDYTGELKFDGLVRLDKPSNTPIAVNDGKSFDGWDGNVLSLTDGRNLKPVKRMKK